MSPELTCYATVEGTFQRDNSTHGKHILRRDQIHLHEIYIQNATFSKKATFYRDMLSDTQFILGCHINEMNALFPPKYTIVSLYLL